MINDLISIFKSSATRKQLIETNGEYILNEICSYAKITEGLNDEFILEAEFEILAPVKKEIYDLLTHENILKVPDEYGDEFFTIFDIYKTADYIKVIARQITIAETLDLFLEDVRPKETNGAGAITHIFANTTQKHELTVSSDITYISTAYYNCKNVYEALHDCDMSFQNRWGGEVYRRQFNLHINKKVGSYRGVKIKSNKNLTGFEENTNKDSVCTRIYPKGFNGITIEEKFVDSPNIGMYKRPISRVYTFEDVKVRDEKTGEDEEVFETLEEAQEELKKRAKALFEEDKVDLIKAYYTINHVDLRTTEEYKNYSATEMTCIGDEVDVEEETLGIDIRTRVVKRKYNILTKEREETELSNVGLKRVITLPDLEKEFEKIPNTESFLEAAKEIATGLINAGIKNSHVVVRKNEILIMDTDDINTAQKVWRFNVNGLGYSSTGYYGQFGLAMTMDGSIVADFITTGILQANLIKSGVLASHNGITSINMENGTFNFADKLEFNGVDLNCKGKFTTESENYKLELNANKLIGFKGIDTANPMYSAGVWWPNGAPAGYVSVSKGNAETVDTNGALWMTAYPNDNDKAAGIQYMKKHNDGTYVGSIIEFSEAGSISLVSQKTTGAARYGLWSHPDGYIYPYQGDEQLGSNIKPWNKMYCNNLYYKNYSTPFSNSTLAESYQVTALNEEVSRTLVTSEVEKYKDDNSFYTFYKDKFESLVYTDGGNKDRLVVNPNSMLNDPIASILVSKDGDELLLDNNSYITSLTMALKRSIEKIEKLEDRIKVLEGGV